MAVNRLESREKGTAMLIRCFERQQQPLVSWDAGNTGLRYDQETVTGYNSYLPAEPTALDDVVPLDMPAASHDPSVDFGSYE